jgi:integrase
MERTTAEPINRRWKMRAHLEEDIMTRQEIYQKLAEAKEALKPTHEDAATVNTIVTEDAQKQYIKIAKRIIGVNQDGKMIFPHSAHTIISSVQESKTKSTLRKYARAVRHVSIHMLNILLKNADAAQRNGDWKEVEKIVSQPEFCALVDLAKLMPADYGVNWVAKKPRKGKKSSIKRLPHDWREQMAAISKGQYRLPMIVCLLTGCRPIETTYGVILKVINGVLYVRLKGAKVKENAGQEYRILKVSDHPLTAELIGIIGRTEQDNILVKAKNANSVTTHMRNVAKKLWPRRKESITVYSARHAMSADCKQAIFEGADIDLASKVLGHSVDKTASYYGTRSQSGGISVAPSEIKVPKEIKHKSAERNASRKLPSQKNKVRNTFKP